MAVTFKGSSAASNKPLVQLIAYGYGDGFLALIPKIDKLSFTYDIPVHHHQPVLANLYGSAGEKQEFKNLSSKGSRYQKRFSLTEPTTGETVLIEADPKASKTATTKPLAFLRFEFNPAALGPSGVAFLREQLEGPIFTNQHTWKQIASGCRVSRIDLAVDLIGVQTASLLIAYGTPGKKGSQGKKLCIFAGAGALETAYPKFAKGKPAPVIVYDKAQQLADAQLLTLYGEKPHARVEFRVQPNRPIIGLSSMKNPFLGLSIVDPIKLIVPPETQHSWDFFLDSCRHRGRAGALSLLAAGELRTAYAQALKAADRNVWRPETLWAKWPKALLRSGLVP